MANEQFNGKLIQDLMETAERHKDDGKIPKLSQREWMRFFHDAPEMDEDDFEAERR